MAHGDAREGKWRVNWRMEWVASTLHTTSEHGASSITTADAHTSAASSRLKWRPRWFRWTRPFRRKTKSGFCACAISFELASTTSNFAVPLHQVVLVLTGVSRLAHTRKKTSHTGHLTSPRRPIHWQVKRLSSRILTESGKCGGYSIVRGVQKFITAPVRNNGQHQIVALNFLAAFTSQPSCSGQLTGQNILKWRVFKQLPAPHVIYSHLQI